MSLLVEIALARADCDIVMSVWPTIEPRGVIDGDLVAVVEDLIVKANNLRGSLGDEIAGSYHAFVEDAAGRLASRFDQSSLDRLLRTQTYWATIGAAAHRLRLVIDAEIVAVSQRLSDLAVELNRFRRHWCEMASDLPFEYVLPDTNVYTSVDPPGDPAFSTLDIPWFDRVDWHQLTDQRPDVSIRLLVPLVVIDELDNLKTRASDQKQKTRARHTLKKLEELFQHNVDGRMPLHKAGDKVSFEEVTIEVLSEPLRHQRLALADAEIVDRGLSVQTLTGRQVTLVSNDTGMLLRARQVGLPSTRYAPI